MTRSSGLSGLIRAALRGVGALVGTAVLGLVPAGVSSTSSEILLGPYLPRSAHQAYGYSLAFGRLDSSPARDWVEASEQAIFEPRSVELPLDIDGKFDPARPQAVGLAFETSAGRRVLVQVETVASRETEVFVDLFDGTARAELLESAPPSRFANAVRSTEVTALEPGRYVLRVQPEIGYAGEYRIVIRSAPLLTFPVEGRTARAIQSGFGAERDGGTRSHRGVDIFAPRGTRVLAAMDAWVSRVDTTPRGGNVVWLQPLFGSLRLYYAHLDTQLVEAGDFVLAGDPVGTVGNTGNAITTPPHLHFGVYLRRRGMRGGARDPYPFLD